MHVRPGAAHLKTMNITGTSTQVTPDIRGITAWTLMVLGVVLALSGPLMSGATMAGGLLIGGGGYLLCTVRQARMAR